MNVVNLVTLQGNAAFALDQGVWALVVIPGALFIQAQITGVLLVVLTGRYQELFVIFFAFVFDALVS
jgi:hypothetical protein